MTRGNILANHVPTEDGIFEMHNAFETLDLAALAEQAPTAKEFAIEKLVPFGEVSLFNGPGSIGKSLLALQLGAAMAGRCGTALGLSIADCPAIYLGAEDGKDQLHWRLHHVCKPLGVDLASLAGRLHVICRRGELGNELCEFDHDGHLQPSGTFMRLEETIDRTAARVVFLDNLAHLFPGNENDRYQVTQFANLLAGLADKTGAAIIMLAHPNKSGSEYSGSTAWLNAVRSQFTMEAADDGEPDLRTLKASKANYGPKGEVARFRWHDWAFVRDDDLPPSVAAEINSVSRNTAANDAFLACLRKATEQGRNVSHSGATNYAPRVFARMPAGKGFTESEFELAMERLLSLGVIKAGEMVGRYENRSPKYGLAEVDVTAQSPAQSPHNRLHKERTIAAQSPHNRAHAQLLSPTEIEGGAPSEGPPPSPEEDYIPPGFE